MTFFESLLLLMAAAVFLLQVARRLSLPYPALLAAAGVVVAIIPGTPTFPIDPTTSLALFIAPVLVDAAFDFPPGAALRFWVPLVTFAVIAVALTAVVVGGITFRLLGIPWAACLALGAIVAPPDAAAAAAVLQKFSIPRSTDSILKGESLFNDATALLLFSGSLHVLNGGELHSGVGLQLLLAAPGGIVFGIACAYLLRYINPLVKGTLGGNLLQFVVAYLVWIAADHLRFSPVLSVIAMAMTLARTAKVTGLEARMRIQSYAVWSAVVFTLNVLAFLVMGMQARSIVGRMRAPVLREALGFAATVVLAVIVMRMLVVIVLNRVQTWWDVSHGRPPRATFRQALFVGWSGMRGFVTLATAFALPDNFPKRDEAVLAAFCVVLATLVVQGSTLAPVIRWLKLDRSEDAVRELSHARTALASAGLDALAGKGGPEAENLRYRFRVKQQTCSGESGTEGLDRFRELGLGAITAERLRLERLRNEDRIGVDAYLGLQEQLDWNELTLLRDDDRKIEEI